MTNSSPQQANSRSAFKKSHIHCGNPKVHYHIHNSIPIFHILSPYWTSIIVLSSHTSSSLDTVPNTPKFQKIIQAVWGMGMGVQHCDTVWVCETTLLIEQVCHNWNTNLITHVVVPYDKVKVTLSLHYHLYTEWATMFMRWWVTYSLTVVWLQGLRWSLQCCFTLQSPDMAASPRIFHWI